MMSNDTNGDEFHHQKALRIKQDDKFFTRLLSKETSMANSSCRVYYGGASGSVPFIWESHPGTPKHPTCDNYVPPLTPPPSYYSSLKSKSKSKSKQKNTLFSSIFPSLVKKQDSPASSRSSTTSWSSSSLSSWSSSLHDSGSSSSGKVNRKLFRRQMSYFSCSRSPVHDYMDDDDVDHEDDRIGSPVSTLCFAVKRRGLNRFKGCQSMSNMKKALISIVSHGN